MGNSRIQLRRGMAAHWTDENPTLHPGEPGFEKDTRKLKIGDGETPWRELEYFAAGVPVEPGEPTDDAALLAHIHDPTPHPIYDDGPSFALLYANAKV